MKVDTIREKILKKLPTTKEERKFIANALDIVKIDAPFRYTTNPSEYIKAFYKKAKEDGYKYAFRTFLPHYYIGVRPELYKFHNFHDIWILNPIVKMLTQVKVSNIEYNKENPVYTQEGAILGFLCRL